MKHLIASATLLSGIAVSLSAALTDEDIIRLMDERPIEGYSINPAEHGLSASSSGFIILNYDQAAIEGIWKILENPEQQEHWKQAYRSLRRISTADSKSIDYDRLVEQIKQVEESKDINDETKINLLMLAYPAVARHRNNQAYDFIKARIDFEFWESNEISRMVYNSHGAGSKGILETAQSMAINALPELQTEEAYALLQSLFSDVRYTSKPHLNILLSGILEYGGWNASASRLQTIQTEYAKRLELRVEAESPQDSEELSVEPSNSSPDSKVEEVAQESTASVSEARKSAEVTTAEPSEELIEESPNWWLWLIGGVIVVGCIVLIARRKS